MSFHLINSSSIKYSSIESQKIHEYEYKKFLQTLPRNNSNTFEQKLFNNNYFNQRQINQQYRQNKRKHEYERIEKENFKFSQRLMNAKACLNRYEQQTFFDKHCQIKQRLQHYPPNQTSINHLKITNKPIDSSFFIYSDNSKSHKSREKDLLLPRLMKPNPPPSKLLLPSPNIIDWNKSKQPLKSKIVSSSINYLYKAPI